MNIHRCTEQPCLQEGKHFIPKYFDIYPPQEMPDFTKTEELRKVKIIPFKAATSPQPTKKIKTCLNMVFT